VREHRYAVYIMASHSGTLYIGMTNDIYDRTMQHKRREGCWFTTKYGCTRLVYYETYRYVRSAIKREKYLKGLLRAKKVALIESVNPKWVDLAADWGRPIKPLSPASKGSFAPALRASAQDDSSRPSEIRASTRAATKGRHE